MIYYGFPFPNSAYAKSRFAAPLYPLKAPAQLSNKISALYGISLNETANIKDGSYFISTSAYGYRFDPEGSWVDIPQAEIQYCNFTSRLKYCSFCGYKANKH